jgi:PAS domain S-box-containing protein
MSGTDIRIIEEESSLRRTLEEERLRYFTILDVSDAEYYVFDADTMLVTYANKKALENLGYTIEQLRKLSPLDLKPDYNPDAFVSLIAPLMDGTKKLVSFETTHLRRDGTRYPVRISVRYFENCYESAFIEIAHDITEQKSLDAVEQNDEARYSSMIDFSPDPCLVVKSGKVLLANSLALDLLGASAKNDVLGKSVSSLFQSEGRERIEQFFCELGNSGNFMRAESRMECINGGIRHVEIFGETLTRFGCVRIILRDMQDHEKRMQNIS